MESEEEDVARVLQGAAGGEEDADGRRVVDRGRVDAQLALQPLVMAESSGGRRGCGGTWRRGLGFLRPE